MKIPSFFVSDRRLLATTVCTLSLLVVAGAAHAQGRTPAEIRDTAGMFSEEAIAKAKLLLRNAIKSRVPIVIETVESLRGETIEEAALNHARRSGGDGIYVLASRRDHKIDVVVSEAFRKEVTEEKRVAIQKAFTDGFRQGDFDKGLLAGVGKIREDLAGDLTAEAETSRPPDSTPGRGRGREDGPSGLVLRNQVRLTLAGARRIVAGAEARAAELGLKMNIAVVDDGGHMLAFERMDGARPASGYTATTKAVTAATFRAPTGPVPAGTTSPDPLLNLSLQNAALASGGKVTTLLGGVPVMVNDQVIGGVGVGGGSGEQDATVARAGIDAFLADLKASDHADDSKDSSPAVK